MRQNKCNIQNITNDTINEVESSGPYLKTLTSKSKHLFKIVGLTSAIFMASVTNLSALDVMVGINIPSKDISITDKNQDAIDDIATFSSKFKVAPSVGLRTEPNYISDGQFGYFFQFDGATFDIDTQEINDEDDPKDIGTSISGSSLLAVPTIFYHFNKSQTAWSQKFGIGVGASYLDLRGDFIVTDNTHPEYNQKIDVDTKGWGMAVGVFFEVSNDKHLFIIQNFAPTISDDKYEYQQHNIDMMYRYKFTIDNFPFRLN